jgi:hypothetical protein
MNISYKPLEPVAQPLFEGTSKGRRDLGLSKGTITMKGFQA